MYGKRFLEKSKKGGGLLRPLEEGYFFVLKNSFKSFLIVGIIISLIL